MKRTVRKSVSPLWRVVILVSSTVLLSHAAATNSMQAGFGDAASRIKAVNGTIRDAVLVIDDIETSVQKVPAQAKQLDVLAKSLKEKEREVAELQEQIASLENGLHAQAKADNGKTAEEMKQEIAALEERAAKLKSPNSGATLASLLKEKERELDGLKKQVASLKDGLKAEGTSDRNDPLDELKRQLSVLDEQLAKLKKNKEIADADLARVSAAASVNSSKARLGAIEWLDRKPVYVFLVGGNVVPMEEPYFEFEQGRETRGNYIITYLKKATRVKDGEPFERSIARGGILLKQLDKASPSANVIEFRVRPDAVETYRKAAEFVKAKGFKIFWRPYDDKPLGGSSSGGGKTPGS